MMDTSINESGSGIMDREFVDGKIVYVTFYYYQLTRYGKRLIGINAVIYYYLKGLYITHNIDHVKFYIKLQYVISF